MRHAPVTPRAQARVCVQRQGITLLEVVVSLAIFLFSIVAIGYLTNQGSERAYQTLQKTLALQLCQSKLAEAGQGVLDFSNLPSGYQSFDFGDDSALKDFQWQITADPSTIPDLYDVTVSVQRDLQDGKVTVVTLSQKIFNPTKRGSTADKLPTDSSTQPQSGTTGTMN
jgi:type II secretory pathway pseudopilin PulG